jgi:beta-galactosidase
VPTTPTVYRGTFDLPDPKATAVSLLLRDVGEQHTIYINGKPIAQNVSRDPAGHQFDFDPAALRPGKNVIAIIATPQAPAARGARGGQGTPTRGTPAVVKVVTSAGGWKRNLFSGLAQIIVQSTGQSGEITLTATAKNLPPAVLKVQAQPVPPR